MKSKILSNENRSDIISKVRAKAEKKWDASPLNHEMKDIVETASAIVRKVQDDIVPKAHQKILKKYGSGEQRTMIKFTVTATGEPMPSVYKSAETVTIHINNFHVVGAKPKDYPDGASAFVRIFAAEAPTLLTRYAELTHLKKCEVDAIVDVFIKLLAPCNTTKQVAAVPELKQFLPDYLVSWEPKSKKPVELNTSDMAILADMADIKDKK